MKKKRLLILIVGIVLLQLAILVVVIIAACGYGFFIADDFSHAVKMKDVFSLGESISIAIWETVYGYINYTGTYFSMFMDYLLEPFSHGGFLFLHGMLVIFFLFFFCSIIFFLYVFFFENGIRSKSVLIIMIGCVIWSYFNYRNWSQVLFWFTAVIGYELPLACLLCMLTFYRMAHKQKRVLFYVLSLVFGVGAMGGVLCVAFVGCYVLLLEMIRYIRIKNLTKGDIVVVLGGVLLGAINAMAPGNYVRADLVDAGSNMNVLIGIVYACRTCIIQLEQLLKDTAFLLVLFVVFFIGVQTKESYDKKTWEKTLLFLTLPAVAIFPAVIGYRSPYMPNRVLFIGDFFLILSIISVVLQVGRYISCRFQQHMANSFFSMITIFAVIVAAIALPYRIEDGIIYKLGKICIDGTLKGYYEEMVSLDEMMRASKRKKVIVDLPEFVDGFVGLSLGRDEEDQDYWINQAMCRYYGVDLITVRED